MPDHLTQIITETASEYELQTVTALPETMEQVGETYKFTVVWDFPDVVPPFPYSDTVETLYISEDEEYQAEIQFRSVDDNHPDTWIESDEPYIRLAGYDGLSMSGIEALKTALSEIHLDVDDLIEFVTEEPNRVELVEIAAYTTETGGFARKMADQIIEGKPQSDELDPDHDESITLHLTFSPLHPREYNKIRSPYRFNHVSWLVADHKRYPVKIICTHTTDNQTISGQIIHTSEFLVENDIAPEVDIEKKLSSTDFKALLHEDSPFPEGPGIPGANIENY